MFLHAGIEEYLLFPVFLASARPFCELFILRRLVQFGTIIQTGKLSPFFSRPTGSAIFSGTGIANISFKCILSISTISLLAASVHISPALAGNSAATSADNINPPIGIKTVTPSGETGYRTPLAGEPYDTVIMGETVKIPPADRNNVTAITVGGELYAPKQGKSVLTPLYAFYFKRVWATSRTRNTISIFVNDLEYDKSFGHLEFVTRLENSTIPEGEREIRKNREIRSSEVISGTATGSIGPGIRYRVAPFQTDNDFRLQLLARAGYFYAEKGKNTTDDVLLPPDTMIYGLRLRGRYDGLHRNLLELPHQGGAAGFDFDYMHRDKWSDFGRYPDGIKRWSETRDYMQYSGYLTIATGLPGLSEKNRIILSLNGGVAPLKSVDRYNAVRIVGGPHPAESDDISRPYYPGARYDSALVADYLLAGLRYRREFLPFLYISVGETFIHAEKGTVSGKSGKELLFRWKNGAATTIGIDTGFLWDSSLYLGYSWDTGFIRDGRGGSSFIMTWNKSL